MRSIRQTGHCFFMTIEDSVRVVGPFQSHRHRCGHLRMRLGEALLRHKVAQRGLEHRTLDVDALSQFRDGLPSIQIIEVTALHHRFLSDVLQANLHPPPLVV